MRSSFQRAGSLMLSAILVVFIAIASSSAQTKKKKKHATAKKSTAAKTTTQPSSSDARVVSLADQYQDSSSQIIDPSAVPNNSQAPASDDTAKKLRDIQSRVKKLETSKPEDEDQKQKRLLTNLDILTKAEQRAEDLRKQKFELMEKENTIHARLDQIDIESRPEMIDRAIALNGGSMRPEELRDAKVKSLEAEKRNLQSLLNEITATRTTLEQNIIRADGIVEKLRSSLEKDIDNTVGPDHPDDQ